MNQPLTCFLSTGEEVWDSSWWFAFSQEAHLLHRLSSALTTPPAAAQQQPQIVYEPAACAETGSATRGKWRYLTNMHNTIALTGTFPKLIIQMYMKSVIYRQIGSIFKSSKVIKWWNNHLLLAYTLKKKKDSSKL